MKDINSYSDLYVFGKFLGCRDVSKTDRNTGEMYKEFFFGIEVPVKNGFENQTRITEIKLTKQNVNDGAFGRFNDLIGKAVGFPINVLSRAYKDRVFTTNYADLSRSLIAANEVK